MKSSHTERQAMKAAVQGSGLLGITTGLVIGLVVGVGGMHVRFGQELTYYDTARTYASNCAFALKTLAEHPNLEFVLDKTN